MICYARLTNQYLALNWIVSEEEKTYQVLGGFTLYIPIYLFAYAMSWSKQLGGWVLENTAPLSWLLTKLFHIYYWKGRCTLKISTQGFYRWVGGMVWVWFQQITLSLLTWVGCRYTRCLATNPKEVKWMNEKTRNLFTGNKTFKYQWMLDYGTMTFKSEILNPKIKR